MKRNKLALFVLLPLLALFSACDNAFELDINRTPDYPATASTPLLVSSGVAWSSSQLGSDVQLLGSIWSQHYTQNNSSNQYKTIDSYNLTNGTLSRVWSSMYSGALADFRIAIAQAEKEKSWSYWTSAKVMTAFDYYILSSLYEKIPFSESLQGASNVNPKFDEGKVVNAGIIKILDEVIAKKADALAAENMKTNDMIFGGDISKWIQFAKSLKLKVLMREFDANKDAIQALLTENDLLTSDAKLANFIDQENYSNPLYENDRRKLNTANNIRGSATLITYLNANGDPRVEDFFEPVTKNINGTPSAPNVYRGLDQGSAEFYTQLQFPTEAHSRARLAATDPVYFMSAVEVYFMKAEAYARLNNPAAAKTNYDLGVTAAFARWNRSVGTLLTGTYAFDATDLDSMLKCIMTQKWIASTRCQAWDAFFDINRTGIPALGSKYTSDAGYVIGTLTPSMYSVLVPGDFPRRLLFPNTSSDNNPNTPKVSDYPVQKKMWWHK
jgi:hypothetical protein